MSPIDRLDAALKVVLEEARSNADFRARLEAALIGESAVGVASTGTSNKAGSRSEKLRPRNRRERAVIDPYTSFASNGEEGLRAALAALDIEKLKDIIAEYDMDRDRLALKWRKADRLIERIVEHVIARSRKGDAFLKE